MVIMKLFEVLETLGLDSSTAICCWAMVESNLLLQNARVVSYTVAEQHQEQAYNIVDCCYQVALKHH